MSPRPIREFSLPSAFPFVLIMVISFFPPPFLVFFFLPSESSLDIGLFPGGRWKLFPPLRYNFWLLLAFSVSLGPGEKGFLPLPFFFFPFFSHVVLLANFFRQEPTFFFPDVFFSYLFGFSLVLPSWAFVPVSPQFTGIFLTLAFSPSGALQSFSSASSFLEVIPSCEILRSWGFRWEHADFGASALFLVGLLQLPILRLLIWAPTFSPLKNLL